MPTQANARNRLTNILSVVLLGCRASRILDRSDRAAVLARREQINCMASRIQQRQLNLLDLQPRSGRYGANALRTSRAGELNRQSLHLIAARYAVGGRIGNGRGELRLLLRQRPKLTDQIAECVWTERIYESRDLIELLNVVVLQAERRKSLIE